MLRTFNRVDTQAPTGRRWTRPPGSGWRPTSSRTTSGSMSASTLISGGSRARPAGHRGLYDEYVLTVQRAWYSEKLGKVGEWKVHSPKFISTILHRTGPKRPETPDSSGRVP